MCVHAQTPRRLGEEARARARALKNSMPLSGPLAGSGARLQLRRGTRRSSVGVGEQSKADRASASGGSSLVVLGVGAPLADARRGMTAGGDGRGERLSPRVASRANGSRGSRGVRLLDLPSRGRAAAGDTRS